MCREGWKETDRCLKMCGKFPKNNEFGCKGKNLELTTERNGEETRREMGIMLTTSNSSANLLSRVQNLDGPKLHR